MIIRSLESLLEVHFTGTVCVTGAMPGPTDFMTAFQEHPQSWTRVCALPFRAPEFFAHFVRPSGYFFCQVDTILETTQVCEMKR